jgi:hypothetical protein
MASKNVETLRAAHESRNKRDFQGVIRNATEVLVYTDHSRNIALITRDKFREWTEAWAKGFSDARITNPEYIDAGDIMIAQFGPQSAYCSGPGRRPLPPEVPDMKGAKNGHGGLRRAI